MNSYDQEMPVLLQNETDILDLEQRCRIIVGKKNTLERQLKETQFQMHELTLTKLDLEKKIDSDRREIFDITAQLKLLQTAMQQWEQERVNVRDTTTKQKLQIESLTTERNSLKERMKQLEVENMKLKSKVSEIENKLLDQKALENIMEIKKASINSTFELIFAQNKKIEKEYTFLRKNLTVAKSFGEQMIKLLTLHHQVLNRVYAENDKLKERQFVMNSKIDSQYLSQQIVQGFSEHGKLLNTGSQDLTMARNSHPVAENYLQECHSMILALDRRINEEIEEKKKLNDSLKSTLKEQMKYLETEEPLKDRRVEMERITDQLTFHEATQAE